MRYQLLNIILLFFHLTILTAQETAEPIPLRRNILKLNSLPVCIGEFFPIYEGALNNSESILLGLPLTVQMVSVKENSYTGSYSFSSIGGLFEYRFYLRKNAPNSLYYGPFVVFRQQKAVLSASSMYNLSSKSFSSKGNNYGGGLTMGYQWILKNRLCLDLFWGVGYFADEMDDIEIKFINSQPEYLEVGYLYAGWLPRIGFSVGYNF